MPKAGYVLFILVLLLATWPVAASNRSLPENVLWIDLPANGKVYNSQAEVDRVTAKIKAAGFQAIVVDVKAYTGFVGYQSKIAPHISSTKIPSHQGVPPDFDILAAFIRAAQPMDIAVYASLNIFSEGSVYWQDGPLFTNELLNSHQTVFYYSGIPVTRPDGQRFYITAWNQPRQANQLVKYTPTESNPSGYVPTNRWGIDVVVKDNRVVAIADRQSNILAEAPQIPPDGFALSGSGRARQFLLGLQVGDYIEVGESSEPVMLKASEYTSFSGFVNPLNPDVQDYQLSLIEEVLAYDIDGLILDRARYANKYADFSWESRQAFEAYLGRKVENWPGDIMVEELVEGGRKLVLGPLAPLWFEWRASNILEFVQRVRSHVTAQRPDILLGVYVGSWYNHYFSEGVNWARPGYQPSAEWASPNYHRTGYAHLLDLIMVGAYYPEVTIQEALANELEDWQSVEGAIQLAGEVVGDAAPLYGSLYLLDYEHNPEQYRKAVEMIKSQGLGLMLFDVHYLELFDWWDQLNFGGDL